MKTTIKFVVAPLCAAFSIAFAQTVPPPMLAKAAKVEIVMTAPSVQQEFRTTVVFPDGVKSRQDIVDKLEDLPAEVEVNDPKDTITTTAVIYGVDVEKLFISQNSFKLEKVGYAADGKPIYQTPQSAEYMFFELVSDPIPFPGVTGAWATTYNGEVWGLQCSDEGVIVPGWMSLSNVSEIVINGAGGTWKYDMNTGLLLTSQDAGMTFGNVYFNGLQQVGADSYGYVTIYTQPRYGYVPIIEFNNQGGRFQLNFSTGNQYDDTKPIAVRITTLDDLRSGRGWKVYNFPQGGLDLNLPAGVTYYIYPEYDTAAFNRGFSTVVATTPAEG